MTKLAVVTAGTSNPSSSRLLGERLADATVTALLATGVPAEVQHIELRTLAGDLANQIATRLPGPALREALDAVCGADGVIAVTPVMNGSYSGLFKLFFDALDEGAMKGRPVLLGATGGTARHSLVIEHAMLPLFYYLKAPVAPHPVFAATKDWGTAGGKLEKRISRAAEAFAQQVMGASPAKGGDDFEVVDFAELLGGA
jgi:FMN reductase